MASKVEFLLTAVAFIMVIVLPTSQLIIGQISSLEHWNSIQTLEKRSELFSTEILRSPGDPTDWGITRLTSFPDKFGLADENSGLMLDANKISRLDIRNPYYLPYDATDSNGLLITPDQGNLKELLGLDDFDIEILLLPYFNLTLKEDRNNVIIKTTDWSSIPLSNVNVTVLAINEQSEILLKTNLLTDDNGEATLSIGGLRSRANTLLLFAMAQLDEGMYSYNYMYVMFRPQNFDSDILRASILEYPDPGHLNVTVYVQGAPNWFNATMFYLDRSGNLIFKPLESVPFTAGPTGWYKGEWIDILVPSDIPVFLVVNLRIGGTRGTGFYSFPSTLGFYSNREDVTKNPLSYGERRETAKNIVITSMLVTIRKSVFLVVIKCYY